MSCVLECTENGFRKFYYCLFILFYAGVYSIGWSWKDKIPLVSQIKIIHPTSIIKFIVIFHNDAIKYQKFSVIPFRMLCFETSSGEFCIVIWVNTLRQRATTAGTKCLQRRERLLNINQYWPNFNEISIICRIIFGILRGVKIESTRANKMSIPLFYGHPTSSDPKGKVFVRSVPLQLLHC